MGGPTILSRYNEGDVCGACETRLRAAGEPVPESKAPQRTHQVPKTKPGTITARILDAMPGTAAEIAERIGHDPRKTSLLCTLLCGDGRAWSTGERGGHRGYRTVYSRVENEAA